MTETLAGTERARPTAVPKPRVRYTYEDYRRTPDDERFELLDGELIVVPAPRVDHQRIVLRLASLLDAFVEERRLGVVLLAPCDVVLSDTDVVQPDVLFVAAERAHIIVPENVRGAPDLVVEVLSPSSAKRDRIEKPALYAKHAVREYWHVDVGAGTLTVLRLADTRFEIDGVYGKGRTVTSPSLPGLRFTLDRVFRSPRY